MNIAHRRGTVPRFHRPEFAQGCDRRFLRSLLVADLRSPRTWTAAHPRKLAHAIYDAPHGALAPVSEFLSLRGGLTVPRPACELALDLEHGGRVEIVEAGGLDDRAS